MQQLHPNYSLTRTRAEGSIEEDFVNPLPRAVLRANSFMLLDGTWSFAVDTEDDGLEQKWYLGHQYTSSAHWPGSIEEHMEAAGIKERWKDKVVAWYECEFPQPHLANGNGNSHSLLQLTFGACGYETTVWLNGNQLKTVDGKDVHQGEYTSFSYELCEADLRVMNRLTVRIADTMDADIPRGKQESHVYKRGGIWYQTYSGGVRSVWLETVEKNRLRSRVGVVSIVEDNLVRFNLTTRIQDAGNYVIRLKIYNRKATAEAPVAQDEFPLKLEAGEKEQRLVVEIPAAKYWSPEEPNLYVLVAELVDESGYAAAIETHFGLRKIEARGHHVYLNQKQVYLDGILYQPGTATYDEIKNHLYAMKKLGCNLVRIHIAGVDPRIYNLADKIGMLLWVEVPSPHSSNDRSRGFHREELERMLALIGTHPSVVIWSLYNEDWGAQDIATNPATRDYIMGRYHYIQIAYPQFLVVDNDGWQHVSYRGRLKSDLLTAHLYTPDLQQWRQWLDEIVSGKMEGVAAYPLIVGDPFFYRRQVPLVVSEWGGFGFPAYGGPKDADHRTAMIQAYKEELRKRPIAGDVYTQATNIEDERNGLIDATTGALSVPEGVLNSRDKKQA